MPERIDFSKDNPLNERRLKERYRVVFSRLGISIVEWDYENDSFYSSLSYDNYVVSQKDQSTLPYRSVYPDTVHPDDYDILSDFKNRFGQGENHLDVVVRIAMISGGYRWTHVCNDRVLSETGDTLRIITTYMDVDEEYRAKQELQYTTDRLSNLISSIPTGVGIFEVTSKVRPEFMSEKACEIFGYTRREAMELYRKGEPLTFLPQDSHIPDAALNALLQGEAKEFTVHAQKKNGEQFWVRITCSAKRSDDGDFRCYVTFLDVTDRVEAEREYQLQAERYRILSEASDVVTFDYDPFTDTLNYNMSVAGEGLQAFTEENYTANLRKSPRLHPNNMNSILENIARALEQPTEGHFDFQVDLSGRGFRWKRAAYVSVADQNGRVYRVVGRLDDVHDELTRLKRDAQVDGMTGILNKTASKQAIESSLLRSGRTGTDALLIMDLDNFKTINDTLGHVEGDRILSETGRALQKLVRGTDIVGRFGGDEFIIYMPGVGADRVSQRAQELKAALAKISKGSLGNVTVSAGIALLPPSHTDFDSALRKADSALYEAKNSGRNRFVIHE